jgi:hypothetical protein
LHTAKESQKAKAQNEGFKPKHSPMQNKGTSRWTKESSIIYHTVDLNTTPTPQMSSANDKEEELASQVYYTGQQHGPRAASSWGTSIAHY